MNEALIENWNSCVQPSDTVYCLGDLSLALRPVEIITPRLNGHKILIPGNHDWCHPYNRKSRNNRIQHWIDTYSQAGWEVLPPQISLDIPDFGPVLLCHFPYSESESPAQAESNTYHDKYREYRPVDDGGWLLCGHVHEKWKTRGRMINVGVDVWDYKPVSLSTLLNYMSSPVGV